jgi:hypothetical protein
MSTEPSVYQEAQKTPPIMRSDGKTYPALSEKLTVFHALLQAGFDPEKAHSIANKGKKTDKTSVYKAQQRIKSFQLAHPKVVRLAAARVKATILMEPQVQEIKGEIQKVYPTFSNALEASKMVLDRADPVHQVHEHHTIADLSPFDMSQYELIPREKVIEQDSTGNE